MLKTLTIATAMALTLSACLGGGRDLPPTLATLASTAPDAPAGARTAVREETVTIQLPIVPQALQVDRVPAMVGETAIAYIEDLVWVDRPNVLFQQLLTETLMRTTNRVVVDPGQAVLNPGTRITGTLSRFDYDSRTSEVVVRYDAAISRGEGSSVETRRFEARVPSDSTPGYVSQSLNVAANQVAVEVANWIGG